MTDETARAADHPVTARVTAFYQRHPYPPPVDDIVAYRGAWDDNRRRTDAALFWPSEPYRDDRSILIGGCGTNQAAHYAVRWPNARVVGIDVSAESLTFAQGLATKHGLDNLELHQLAVEQAPDLGRTFDHVVCTGVLHHLADPDAGLRALREVLASYGAMHLMLYAPYGRTGIYMLQDYCRRLGIGTSDDDISELATSLRALPPDHPLVPLLRNSPDFASSAGLADALLHPQDRAYSVPQLFAYLDGAGLAFGRWIRQAPYLPWCGALSTLPHHARLAALATADQYAAIELFRGTMVRHAAVAYHANAVPEPVDLSSDAWRTAIPLRLLDTIAVRERLPPGASAVLINRNHTFTDLYLPIDARQERWLARIDGTRTIAEIGDSPNDDDALRAFFETLGRWDQIVFAPPV